MTALSLRRVALPSLGLTLSVLVLAGAATAQYPPAVGAGRVSRTSVEACECTLFAGEGFAPGESVTVTDNGRHVATVVADRLGAFQVQLCFDKDDEQGGHDLRAAGQAREVHASVRLRGTACRDFGGLPRTGVASAAAPLLVGFGLVTTGSAAVYAARRRRRVG